MLKSFTVDIRSSDLNPIFVNLTYNKTFFYVVIINTKQLVFLLA